MSKISKKEIGRCFKLILKALETQVDLITTGDFMSRFCSNLGLPTAVQKGATHIARKAVDLDIVPGRSPISVAAAAIYMASQVCFALVGCKLLNFISVYDKLIHLTTCQISICQWGVFLHMDQFCKHYC